VRYKLKNILESYAGGETEEEEKKRRKATINRCLGVLRTIKREMEISGVLPQKIVKEIDRLVAVIQTGMSE
jgi:Arc/MetJ-type ribon-helix-helix transcriptional regulator